MVLAAGCAPTPPLAGPEPDLATPAPPPGEILGEPWIGAPEKTETVAEMMARQTYPKLPHREEFEVPRDNLRQNPDAPSLPRWPPTPQPAKPAHGRPPAKPELPQMPSLSFTGESSAVDALNFAPPDSMGAIGPSQFLFFSNGMIRTYSRLGALDGALNTTDDNFFLSVRTPCTTGAQCSNSGCPADGHCQSTDPRVFYDRQSQHWFLVQIDIASVDRVLIAWTSDTTIKTTTVFHFFQFEHDLVGSCGTTSLSTSAATSSTPRGPGLAPRVLSSTKRSSSPAL